MTYKFLFNRVSNKFIVSYLVFFANKLCTNVLILFGPTHNLDSIKLEQRHNLLQRSHLNTNLVLTDSVPF